MLGQRSPFLLPGLTMDTYRVVLTLGAVVVGLDIRAFHSDDVEAFIASAYPRAEIDAITLIDKD